MSRRKSPSASRLQCQPLESRDLMSATPLPVLMVIADQRHFFYREYNDTRASILAGGIGVVVAATTTSPSTAHAGSGQGAGNGIVTPDIALSNVNPADYSAIAFIGGWGSSMYQYAFNDPDLNGSTNNFYQDGFYNGDTNLNDGVIAPQKVIVNNLVNAFLAEDKYVGGVCHGVTVLAWARVNGVSPVAGRQVTVPLKDGSPAMTYDGVFRNNGYYWGQYDQMVANGAFPNNVQGSIGVPGTTTDDVVVDGHLITASDDYSAARFGQVIAERVLADLPPDNQAPADLTLSANAVPESSPVGTILGSLATTDPDEGNVFEYALASGAGSTDNAAFTIIGNVLQTNATFDHEAKSGYSIRVRTTDQGGLWFEKTFDISVTNVNEPPTDIGMAAGDIGENVAVGTMIGLLTATDPDAADGFVHTLAGGAGATDNAAFTLAGNVLTSAVSFDFESKSQYSIRVRATDVGGLFTEKSFVLTVGDENETPFNLTLSSNVIAEAQPAGTVIGVLSAGDPDADVLSYSLVDGEGSADNVKFIVEGNSLRSVEPFEAAVQSSYSIRVRAADGGGLFVESIFVVTVSPVNDPPTLDNAPSLILPAVLRNAVNPAGVAVASLLTNAADAETPATLGLAVTGVHGIAGRWEHAASPAGPWLPIGTVGESSAKLLAGSAFIRFRPDRNLAGYAGISFRAWDGQTGAAGAVMNPADDPVAFSIDTETAWLAVGLGVNAKFDAQGRWMLPVIKEDTTNPTATVARSTLAFLPARIGTAATDGLAVTGQSGNGVWQVMIGGVWQALGGVSESEARLLKPADKFRFVPAADWSGEATITYRAWDTLNGLLSPRANVNTQAGFGKEALTAVVRVTPVNDAPVLDTSVARVFDLNPQSVGLLTAGAGDIDSTIAGIGITRVVARGGVWQYRPSVNASWASFSAVSATGALLLDPWAEIRFLPDNGVTVASGLFDYKAWDGTTGGVTGDRRPTNSTAFSKTTETSTFSLGNQRPAFNPGPDPAFPATVVGRQPAGLSLAALARRMTDGDRGFLRGNAVTDSTGNGAWDFSLDGGRTWRPVGELSSNRLLLRSTDLVRFTPAAGWSGSASLVFVAWDRTTGVAGDRLGIASDSLGNDPLTATLLVKPV